ncbi:MAG TPA: hypothetical protein VMF09_05455 [Solirubrobacteraceae bacterium]|nr:hypothetical protein [Solirubrobacteraceae bacterium]
MSFVGTLVAALVQGPKPFYYDSGLYWKLGNTFTEEGHFSLLNFNSSARGYVLPLIDHGLQELAEALEWNPSSTAKLFNVLIFALLGAVLAPKLAEIAWPGHRWGLIRRMLLVALLIVYWSGYLSYPLSDFPALTMAVLALVAVSRSDTPGWMLVAGLACGLALDMRASFLLLAPILAALVAWSWLREDPSKRNGDRVPFARRALCAGLLILGFAIVSLPQSLASHRHGYTWSFVPGATISLAQIYLTPGLPTQSYETYVGPGEPGPEMLYGDRDGEKLLDTQPHHEITSSHQYVDLIVSHPIAMTALLARHIINGLDARFSSPYIENLEPGSRAWLRIACFVLVFLALVRALWPAARRKLAPARWRYPVALLLCTLTSVPTPMEARYMLPVYLVVYITALAPGWPSPLGAREAGPRRFRTTCVLATALLAFMAIVWHVTTAAGGQLHFS